MTDFAKAFLFNISGGWPDTEKSIFMITGRFRKFERGWLPIFIFTELKGFMKG